MKGGINRTKLKLGSVVLGWVYWVCPSEDPFSTDDYTAPIGFYVPNKTKN